MVIHQTEFLHHYNPAKNLAIAITHRYTFNSCNMSMSDLPNSYVVSYSRIPESRKPEG